jgi:hypothetical protein
VTTYTTVDDGYEVNVFKSFESLWNSVSNEHRHSDKDAPLYLDEDESMPLTKAVLRETLKQSRLAWIYEPGQGDWTLRIQAH